MPSLTFGDERAFPQGRGDTGFEAADTVSYIRGKHSIKFGVEGRDFRNDNFNGDPGQLIFTSATLTTGSVSSAARTVGNVANRINVGALDVFGMDSWKVTPKLTAELGVRYSWNMTPTEALDRYSVLVPVAGAGSTIVPILYSLRAEQHELPASRWICMEPYAKYRIARRIRIPGGSADHRNCDWTYL